MPQQEAVWLFLTALKHRRDTTRRLFEMAKTEPTLVTTYIASLPDNWQHRDDPEVDLLKRLHALALTTIAERAASVG
ncbi:hypothetical protein A1507_17670 [Methylomonas koyamae]|uniref:Uncharacterized protein n=1 Tax=Methylomonas koyamae TaxID=702114 RepID=A0A177N590_9GAMM|nr:hypothetical protein [Methylomonas koyamae]OAI13197.1 hypothetical protein A1507_17670 [Methylomonas koyamae]